MSELTPCNYCSLHSIKYRAEKKGWNVTVKPDRHGWTSVYVHPPEVDDLSDSADGEPSEYFAASMMEITGSLCLLNNQLATIKQKDRE